MKPLQEIIKNTNAKVLQFVRRTQHPESIIELCKWAREYDLPVTIFFEENSKNNKLVNFGISLQHHKSFFGGGPKKNTQEVIDEEFESLAKGLCEYQGVVVSYPNGYYLSQGKYSVKKETEVF